MHGLHSWFVNTLIYAHYVSLISFASAQIRKLLFLVLCTTVVSKMLSITLCCDENNSLYFKLK